MGCFRWYWRVFCYTVRRRGQRCGRCHRHDHDGPWDLFWLYGWGNGISAGWWRSLCHRCKWRTYHQWLKEGRCYTREKIHRCGLCKQNGERNHVRFRSGEDRTGVITGGEPGQAYVYSKWKISDSSRKNLGWQPGCSADAGGWCLYRSDKYFGDSAVDYCRSGYQLSSGCRRRVSYGCIRRNPWS